MKLKTVEELPNANNKVVGFGCVNWIYVRTPWRNVLLPSFVRKKWAECFSDVLVHVCRTVYRRSQYL